MRRSRIKPEREPYGFEVCVSRELEDATSRFRGRDVEFVLLEQTKVAIRLTQSGRLHSIGTSLPVAFDPEQATMRALGLNGFPNLVVIDRTDHVRLTHTGYNSSETSFRRDLTQLLQSL